MHRVTPKPFKLSKLFNAYASYTPWDSFFKNQLGASVANIKVWYAFMLCSCQHGTQSWLGLGRESFGLATVDCAAAILSFMTLLLYAGLCSNESGIPTTNVLNYDFVLDCLIEWASNNTEAGISQPRHSPELMLPFQIINVPHIKGTQTLSLWSKHSTNKQTAATSVLVPRKWIGTDRLCGTRSQGFHTFDMAKFW